MAAVPAILAQAREFLVINKPAGLPVHPGRTGGPSVEDFFPSWQAGKQGPWLAHRLDQDTAGCLLIALKKSFLRQAQELFADGKAEKIYWAIVQGVPKDAEGAVEASLAKQTQGRRWKMVHDPQGEDAVTGWRCLGAGDGKSLLEFRPLTGRTHQIRVHAAMLGHPILGDAIYGAGQGALQLLARSLALPTSPAVTATAPVPSHMAANVEACGGTL